MIKYLFLGAFAVFAMNATAEDIIFTGTSANSCTFSSVTAGTLTVSGTTFSTDTSATYLVTNNSTNFFKLVIPQSTAFSAAPGSAAVVGDVAQLLGVTAGNNLATAFTGSDAAGWSVDLALVAVDTITHSVSGTISDAEAGAYTVTVAVTCVAQ